MRTVFVFLFYLFAISAELLAFPGPTGLWLLDDSIALHRQGCPQEVIFLEDFGAGFNNPGPELPLGTTTYCYENLQGNCPSNSGITPGSIDDGAYSILNDPSIGIITSLGDTNIWISIEDHTPGDIDGYMLVVNAGFDQEEFYRLDNIAVITGEEYTFSSWFANILSPESVAACGGGQVPVNVNFLVEDAVTGAILGSLSSGDIFSSGNGDWVTTDFMFTATSSLVNIVLVNNAPGGCGNDFAIDDIQLTGCIANTTTAIDDAITGCDQSGLTGNLLANDIDAQGDVQSISSIIIDQDGDLIPESSINVNTTTTIGGLTDTQGAVNDFGDLLVLPDGSVIFDHTPNNLSGTAQFQYVVCDNGIPQICDTASVTITVTCPPDTSTCTPVSHLEPYTGCSGDGYSIVVDGITYDETNPDGIDTLVGAAANGCDSIVTIDLNFAVVNGGIPIDVIPNSATITSGESVQYSTTSASGSLTWFPVDFLSCTTCPDPIATPENSIQYIISLEEAGCFTYDTVMITLEPEMVFIPSAFSPNGDGDNDLFQVIDQNVQELRFLKIYNRWGELLYETNDLDAGWDGTFKGAEQEMDCYIYYVQLIDDSNIEVELRGTFLLLK